MINYTNRLDSAIKKAAWAHEQAGQHRKGTDVPYIIHPIGVMMIASNVTDDEDTLIACLLHDVLEDVDAKIYDADKMSKKFGDRVVSIVKDVTKDETKSDWYEISKAYLDHLEFKACDEAVIVSAADKIHNLMSVLKDYDKIGDKLWDKFSTKSSADQLWWYQSILTVITKRNAPQALVDKLSSQIETLKTKLS